jgi:hypothetical protein
MNENKSSTPVGEQARGVFQPGPLRALRVVCAGEKQKKAPNLFGAFPI